ncbi:hypothetical protein BGX26_001045 [Mortierella sp. AD094]|nr:hypothetical protein BGX26_001045 [Mortierella sp. AD094]
MGLEEECSGQSQIAVIKNAPNLKSLDWQISQSQIFPLEGYLQVMSRKMCPQLESLTVASPRTMTDYEIVLTMDAMTDARVLDFGTSEFSDNAYRSLLSRHAATIRVFIFHRYGAPRSSMIQTIMSNRPSLEVLDTYWICGDDLVQIDFSEPSDASGLIKTENIVLGEDWVCLGLKSLSVEFALGPHRDFFWIGRPSSRSADLAARGFRQLSRLTRLEELNIESQTDSIARALT